MAWYSFRFARALPSNVVQTDTQSIQKLLTSGEFNEHHVLASSRKGFLLMDLTSICEASTSGKQLYLLQESCLLKDDDILQGIRTLEALICEIMDNPSLALEATKQKHSITTTIHADGFEPLEAQVVYANESRIRDGYYYLYTEQEVRNLMTEAYASSDPCTSDDGDLLSDVFNFLKSHLALLKFAAASGHVVAYAEMAD